MQTLILITAAPTTRLAFHAFQLASAMKTLRLPFQVFFYQDGVSVANAHLWHAEDEINLRKSWQSLEVPLPVCVSAALSRGISDQENARRHQLDHHNLGDGFALVGLGTLAEAIQNAHHVVQF